jgi:hypothetical protein
MDSRARPSTHKLIDLYEWINKVSKELERIPETKTPLRRFKASIQSIACQSGLSWQLMHDFMTAGHLFAESTRWATSGREWEWHKLTPGQLRLATQEYHRRVKILDRSASARRRIERGLAISNSRNAFDRYFHRVSGIKLHGLQAIMASIIVGAWTAFEVLAEDLWVAALNSRPRLGLIALDAEIRYSDNEREQEKKKEVIAPLPVWKALDPKFKINKRMGELLCDYGRDFAKRGEAQKSFRKVFPKERASIDAIFDSKNLRWVAATRNAIVHNGGLADGEFKKGVRDHPRLKYVADDAPIPMDGATTYELCVAAIKSGMNLLDFVNSWLKNNEA